MRGLNTNCTRAEVQMGLHQLRAGLDSRTRYTYVSGADFRIKQIFPGIILLWNMTYEC